MKSNAVCRVPLVASMAIFSWPFFTLAAETSAGSEPSVSPPEDKLVLIQSDATVDFSIVGGKVLTPSDSTTDCPPWKKGGQEKIQWDVTGDLVVVGGKNESVLKISRSSSSEGTVRVRRVQDWKDDSVPAESTTTYSSTSTEGDGYSSPVKLVIADVSFVIDYGSGTEVFDYDVNTPMNITASPGGPDDYEFTFTSVPTESDPTNLDGTVLKFSKRGTNLEWQIDKALWYASQSQTVVCWNHANTHDITLAFKYKGLGPVSLPETVDFWVRGMRKEFQEGNGPRLEWEAEPDYEVYPVRATGATNGSLFQFEAKIGFRNYTRTSNVVIPEALKTQYRGLMQKEEEYHKKQFMAEVPFSSGGLTDVLTGFGTAYWTGAVVGDRSDPEVLYTYYIDAPNAVSAQESADALLKHCLTKEMQFTEEKYGLNGKRRCFIEHVAKQDAGFTEFLTLPCSYSSCPQNPDVGNEHRHPAYPN